MASPFESATWRFVTSGVLITVYAIADIVAARRARGDAATAVPTGLRVVTAGAMLGFYALIGPSGGALLGGVGNLVGIGVVVGAAMVRLSGWVRYSALAGKALCCLGLPIATGVPWGLVVLTLPAVGAAFWYRRRAERAIARP